MKVIDFKDRKAKKNNETTPEMLLEDVKASIDDVEHIIYIAQYKDGVIGMGNSTMFQTQTLGLLKIGEQMVINDMYKD